MQSEVGKIQPQIGLWLENPIVGKMVPEELRRC